MTFASKTEAHAIQARLHNQTTIPGVRIRLRRLREGLEMVEEKARFELGMIKSDEVFVPVATAAAASSPAKR